VNVVDYLDCLLNKYYIHKQEVEPPVKVGL